VAYREGLFEPFNAFLHCGTDRADVRARGLFKQRRNTVSSRSQRGVQALVCLGLGKQTANIGVKPAPLQDQTDTCGVALKRPVDLFGSPVPAGCAPSQTALAEPARTP